MSGRLGIDDIHPVVGCGRYPSKAVVGEHIPVGATVWREGHDAVAATVTWTGPKDKVARQTRMVDARHRAGPLRRDVWCRTPRAQWTFRIDAWSDPWSTWRHAVEMKLAAGQDAADLANDLEIGARLLERVGRRPGCRNDKRALLGAAAGLRDGERPRRRPGRSRAVRRTSTRSCTSTRCENWSPGARRTRCWVDRERRALRLLVRVLPPLHRRPGRRAASRCTARSPPPPRELDRVAAMGFDVVYLPPIHPIGRVNRKGPNNTLTAGPGRRRLAVGDRLRRGRPRRDPPGAGHRRGLRRFVAPGRRAGHGGRAGPRAAVRARPPVGDRAPGVVHHPAGRHHRVRREPAQEVPGHLPAQLRQRPARPSTPRCCALSSTGSSTGCGSSGWTTRTPSRRTSGSG